MYKPLLYRYVVLFSLERMCVDGTLHRMTRNYLHVARGFDMIFDLTRHSPNR